MTNPNLGQSLIYLADEIERRDYVDPTQTASILRKVGQNIDAAFATLHARIDALEGRPSVGPGSSVELGLRAPCRDD